MGSLVGCPRFLLDVVQTPRVGFQDGRVMEHLVERDAEEDDVELGRDQEKERKSERAREQERVTEVPFKKKKALCSPQPDSA